MEIPDLVHEELGGEEIRSGVAIGDEDVVCATASRTLVYRSEGFLSDERIETYSHDVEQLVLSEGRRKTTFKLTYVDDTRSFSVPANHGREVLTLLLEGILGVDGVFTDGESVVGAFRFSELTLVIAENRLVRHIGETAWDDDFTQYEYADITGLDFQEGSVATEVVVTIDGRPQRIKTPREDARLVEETIKKAVFEYYDVATMAELRQAIEPTDEDDSIDGDKPADDSRGDFTLGSTIDPLVSEADSDPASVESGTEPTPDSTTEAGTTPNDASSRRVDDAERESPDNPTDNRVERQSTAEAAANERQRSQPNDKSGPAGGESTTAANADPTTVGRSGADSEVATAEDIESLSEQVSELSAAVQQQNQLLKKQHNAIKQLLGKLRDQ